MPLIAPIAVALAALTLRSDAQPVKVFVQKPRGTLYWGGAGLNGDYIKPQLAAFVAAGIKHVNVGLTNSATAVLPPYASALGTFVDAFRAGLPIRYEDDGEWAIAKGMDAAAPQFNLIGYSYGSLLAAQTANFYARLGHVVDHLVLIASPIDADFLVKLKATPNIKKVVVMDLLGQGDRLYAGMPQSELLEALPTLGRQFVENQGKGHFYFAQVVADSPRRWKALAEKVFDAGLR